MKSSKPRANSKTSRTLQLYLYGPGVGESVVIRLPCGQWGVVDCYQSRSATSEGTLAFLQRKGVDRLAFFCHTHPHEDHFLGADLLFAHYAGKIDRIWRHPGFSSKDITTRAVLAASIEAAKLGSPEPKEAAAHYCKLLAAIAAEKNRIEARDKSVFAENYRRISGPVEVMTGKDYCIRALAPSAAILDNVEARLAGLRADLGFSAFSDDSGGFLNDLSVVLQISFRHSEVLLLADAQGATEEVHQPPRKLAVLKIAHHGSENGISATLIAKTKPPTYKISHGILTQYTRSGLPEDEMVEHYRRACKDFAMTELDTAKPPACAVPGLPGSRTGPLPFRVVGPRNTS